MWHRATACENKFGDICKKLLTKFCAYTIVLKSDGYDTPYKAGEAYVHCASATVERQKGLEQAGA